MLKSTCKIVFLQNSFANLVWILLSHIFENHSQWLYSRSRRFQELYRKTCQFHDLSNNLISGQVKEIYLLQIDPLVTKFLMLVVFFLLCAKLTHSYGKQVKVKNNKNIKIVNVLARKVDLTSDSQINKCEMCYLSFFFTTISLEI